MRISYSAQSQLYALYSPSFVLPSNENVHWQLFNDGILANSREEYPRYWQNLSRGCLLIVFRLKYFLEINHSVDILHYRNWFAFGTGEISASDIYCSTIFSWSIHANTLKKEIFYLLTRLVIAINLSTSSLVFLSVSLQRPISILPWFTFQANFCTSSTDSK